jgi:hypothetical protein
MRPDLELQGRAVAGNGAGVQDVDVVTEQVGLVHKVRREQHRCLALPP